MKILRVITSMNPEHGGPCQGIRNSIPALHKLGVHNEVVSFDSPDAAFLGKDSFTIHTLGPAKGPYAYCPKLEQWLLENFGRFDAVIIHGLWLYNGYGTFSAWKKYKKNNNAAPKLFVMPHGMLDPYFQKAAGRKLKAIRNWLFWKLFENRIVNNTSGVLFTCQEELRLAKTTFTPYNPNKEINVGYGITAPPAEDAIVQEAFFSKFPTIKKDNYILFLSRINEKKGVDLLINAYLELLKINNNMPLLVIAGPGLDTVYGEGLQKLVNDSGVSEKVIFTGMLTGNVKWGAIYGSQVFILPSHQENFGIAVAEALACSKAVLITNQINIWKEIEEGKGGIVKTDTQQGVADLLREWLLMDDATKAEMGINANRVYEEHFAIEKAAVQLFKSIS